MSDFFHGWCHYFSTFKLVNGRHEQHQACKKLAYSFYSCYLKGSLSVGLDLIWTNPGTEPAEHKLCASVHYLH